MKDIISKVKKEVKDGSDFDFTRFENAENKMRGRFQYAELEKRLRSLREKIDAETQSWIQAGEKAHKNLDRVAINLAFQFDQCKGHFSRSPNGVNIALEMEKDNPFVWTMVSQIIQC
jgi:ubiquitin-conjugating enzyme E2 Z